VRAGPGLREFETGYETNNCGKLRVRWRGLLHKKGGQNISVSRWEPQTELGRHKTEKREKVSGTWPISDRERDGDSKIKRV